MKKILALGLSLVLILSLGTAALAESLIPEGWTAADGARDLPEQADVVDAPISAVFPVFPGAITVDGKRVDTAGIPGAPYGYLPMRAICEAAGGFADWYPEDGDAFFSIAEHSITVHLPDLSVMVNFETVEGVTAYLDPAGYTFLPLSFLTTLENIKDVTNPALSSIHYDITTVPERTAMETLAYQMMEVAEAGNLMALDAQIMEENYLFHMDAYDELVAYQPRISAQPTSIVMAQVKEGQMDTAKADFAAYHEAIEATLGFYPACAEAVANAKTVESPNGQCLLFVCTWDSNDDCVALFNAAYPARAR